jgi:hypothetical protein
LTRPKPHVKTNKSKVDKRHKGTGETNRRIPNAPTSAHSLGMRVPFHAPYTAGWTLARLREGSPCAKVILKDWSHTQQHREVNDVTINEITSLGETQALEALTELQKPRVFVKGTRGTKLVVDTQIRSPSTLEEYIAKALIDSGCEGSCINRTFVEINRIPTIKLPRPIPIYNADGQPNSDGPISELAILFLTCGTYTERIELGVTHLGREKILLGHDWLRLHNPNIDWQTGMVKFSRCPSLC